MRGSAVTSLDDYTQHCCLYAAAMHHVTGLPVYFLGGGHAIMKSPQGWLDEAGIRPMEEIAAWWGLEPTLDELEEFDYKWLGEMYHGIPGWDEAVAIAREQATRLSLIPSPSSNLRQNLWMKD